MADLKLGTEEAATQIVGRDRYIELLSVLSEYRKQYGEIRYRDPESTTQ